MSYLFVDEYAQDTEGLSTGTPSMTICMADISPPLPEIDLEPASNNDDEADSGDHDMVSPKTLDDTYTVSKLTTKARVSAKGGRVASSRKADRRFHPHLDVSHIVSCDTSNSTDPSTQFFRNHRSERNPNLDSRLTEAISNAPRVAEGHLAVTAMSNDTRKLRSAVGMENGSDVQSAIQTSAEMMHYCGIKRSENTMASVLAIWIDLGCISDAQLIFLSTTQYITSLVDRCLLSLQHSK